MEKLLRTVLLNPNRNKILISFEDLSEDLIKEICGLDTEFGSVSLLPKKYRDIIKNLKDGEKIESAKMVYEMILRHCSVLTSHAYYVNGNDNRHHPLKFVIYVNLEDESDYEYNYFKLELISLLSNPALKFDFVTRLEDVVRKQIRYNY